MPGTGGAHHGLHRGYSSGEDGWGANMSADMLRIDSTLTRSVKSRTVNAQPGSPADGDRYIIGPSPTGSQWSGNAGKFAVYDVVTPTWAIYTPEDGWDCFVADEKVWVERGNGSWWELTEIDASKFSSINAAFAALTTGMALFVPPGDFSISSAITLAVSGIKVRGIRGRSILRATANPTFHMLDVSAPAFEMHNIQMEGGYSSPTSAAWDVLRLHSAVGRDYNDSLFSRCLFRNAARHNLYISDIYETYFNHCIMEQSHNNASSGENHYGTFLEFGLGLVNNTHVEFKSCGFHNNDGGGCYMKQGSSIDFDHCRFETNRGGITSGEANGLRVGSSTAVRVKKCHFELSVALPPAARPESLCRTDTATEILFADNTLNGGTTAGIQPSWGALINGGMGRVYGNRVQQCNGKGIQADISGGVFWASNADSTSPDILASKDVPYLGYNGVTGQNTPGLGFRLPYFTTGALPTPAVQYAGQVVYDSTTDEIKCCCKVTGSYTWKVL